MSVHVGVVLADYSAARRVQRDYLQTRKRLLTPDPLQVYQATEQRALIKVFRRSSSMNPTFWGVRTPIFEVQNQ